MRSFVRYRLLGWLLYRKTRRDYRRALAESPNREGAIVPDIFAAGVIHGAEARGLHRMPHMDDA